MLQRHLLAFSPSTAAANRGKRCRCGEASSCLPCLRPLQRHLLAFSSSTAAANRGKCCRCGEASSCIPSLWLPQRHLLAFSHSTTAANHGKRCRCGGLSLPTFLYHKRFIHRYRTLHLSAIAPRFHSLIIVVEIESLYINYLVITILFSDSKKHHLGTIVSHSTNFRVGFS